MEIIWNSIKSEFGKVHLFSWISKGNWKLLICSLDTWGCHFLRLSANSNNSTSSSRRNLNTEQILNHPCFNIIALASWTFLALHVIVDLSAEVYCFLFIPRHVNVIARMAPFIGRQIVEKKGFFFWITARGETWRSPLHNITSNDIHSVYLTYIVTHRKHSCIDSRKKKNGRCVCVCLSRRNLRQTLLEENVRGACALFRDARFTSESSTTSMLLRRKEKLHNFFFRLFVLWKWSGKWK